MGTKNSVHPYMIAFVGSGIPWIVIEDVRYASA